MALNDVSNVEAAATAKKIESQNLATVGENFASSALGVHYDVDVLSQFRANLEKVEELNGRLRFVLGEVNSLIVRNR